MQKPSIGRIVHYCSRGSADGAFAPEPRAAIITAVGEEDVDLAVINPTGLFFDARVTFSPELKPGHWSWPERV